MKALTKRAIRASAFLSLAAVASFSTAAHAAVPPTKVGEHLSGSDGQASGLATAESRAVTQYWLRHATQAKDLVVTIPSPSGSLSATKPEGPAVQVAGTPGIVKVKGHGRPLSVSHGVRSGGKDLRLFGANASAWGNPSNAPATTTGRVFFTDHLGNSYSCSGSLVNSPAGNVVITAGHCVYGTAGGKIPSGETWHSNWVFAPDYANGRAPYGYWSARQLWTLTNYANHGDEQDDLGAAILNPNSRGQNAVWLLGGQGIAWNEPSSQNVYAFGYPGEAPFNGQTLQYCSGSAGYWGWPGPQLETMPCNMNGGASGGPWLMNFNGQWGYINSVNDVDFSFFGSYVGGLYFGNNAAALYNAVANI